ncbi:MAG: hypothetical protein WCY59_02935 [Anaerovoracaceae bacterium]
MKRRLSGILLALCMVLAILPATAFAAGATRTVDCETFVVEISNVYAIDSASKSATEGYVTTYCVVVPAGATIKCTKKAADAHYDYLLWPFNNITFSEGPMYPLVDYACHYDDAIYVPFAQGDTITTKVNNEYLFSSWRGDRLFNLRIFVVDADTLVQFGGAKPPHKPAYSGNVTAAPSTTDFVVKGKGLDTVMDAPQVVKQAYAINGTNYLQLRAIATLLNRTAAQFNVGWDGQYAVIEPGKTFTSTVTGSKMQNTKDVRGSDTKFKMNGEVFSFSDARLINGSTNYIQLREFAQKLSGTASQFNVYWDTALKQAIIQPGAPYTGTKYEEASTILEQITGEGVLPDGDYYMQISGKFVYPVSGGQYWLELKNERPAKPFNIKLISNDEERGPQYSIGYDGTYIMLPSSFVGNQLQSTTSKTPHPWRINRYSSFCTIRDYDNQKLLVVAEGSTGGGNTTVIGKSAQGSAPDNGKITFFVEAASGGAKNTVQVKTYPEKTTYALGEGFDTAGVLAVLQSGGTEKDISGNVSFYTSKTVQLTQGRPFTTTGKKVVEIRYNGEKIAEYTIVVQ